MSFDFLNSIGDVDTTNVFTPAPAGVYTLRIKEAQVKRNKADTANYINFQCKIEDPGNEAADGKTVFHILSIPVDPNSPDWAKLSPEKEEKQETVIKMFFQALEAITGDNWGDPTQRPRLNLKDLIGRTFRASVIVDEYEGKEQNKIKRIMPDDEESGVPSTPQRSL